MAGSTQGGTTEWTELVGQLIRDGVVSDQAELATLGHVSRARLTQILNLLFLASDIQEKVLFLPPCERGRAAAACVQG